MTPPRSVKWSYGVTTVPGRLDGLFPETLRSLAAAGFDAPHVFVDDCRDPRLYREFEGRLTTRFPKVRTAGHWVLSLYELYCRDPAADRYALFQDDFVTVRNLRAYLDRCAYPETGYWNLYTFPSNQDLAQPGCTGFYPSNQFGRGAVALVFSVKAVQTLLMSDHLTGRPTDSDRGHRAIDGGIVDSFRKAGWTEYVHNPSLTQHTGDFSSMGNKPHKKAVSFPGEKFDALELLRTVPV